MTKHLSEYYRLSLSKGMEWVSLFDEVEMARIYMEIQSVRYKSILSFEVIYDESVRPMRIPKLTLQPLVENAIYHGIKPTCKPGIVRLEVTQTERHVIIRVSDDGVASTSAIRE